MAGVQADCRGTVRRVATSGAPPRHRGGRARSPTLSARPAAGAEAAVAALQELTTLDLDVVRAFVRLLQPADRTARLELLPALTDDTAGRHVTAEVLGQRASERLEDARRATAEYAALVADPHSNETAAATASHPERNHRFPARTIRSLPRPLGVEGPSGPDSGRTKMRRSPPSASAYSLKCTAPAGTACRRCRDARDGSWRAGGRRRATSL
jgi:hypothetical protein